MSIIYRTSSRPAVFTIFNVVQKALRRATAKDWQGLADESSLVLWLRQNGVPGVLKDLGLSDTNAGTALQALEDYQCLVRDLLRLIGWGRQGIRSRANPDGDAI